MSSGFRTQGAPNEIQSNVTGAGLVQGDQLGDQLPGVLNSLQESPEASKVSTLYYNESCGKFHQPSFQRWFGGVNYDLDIHKFGDSASIFMNNDIYWSGPAMLTTTFTIPYAYYGPVAFRPSGDGTITGMGGNTYFQDALTSLTFSMTAGTCTSRPRIFYSWGAGYANIRQVDMNLGGAMKYELDQYSNFVGVMASCVSLCQRAALMKASGSGTMIPDYDGESRYGIAHIAPEIGQIPLYSADGGMMNSSTVRNTNSTYGQGAGPGTFETGCSGIAGPVIEHWTTVIKTPHTNFASMHQMRRPVDTRLFSSEFAFDFYTNSALDTFIDSGTGWQPVTTTMPAGVNSPVPVYYQGLYILEAANFKCWKDTDGLFPSMLYRQLQLPEYSRLVTSTEADDTFKFALRNADITTTVPNVTGSKAQDYRITQYTSYYKIAKSIGYANTYANGGDPLTSPSVGYITPSTLPLPSYQSVVSARRLANDELGAAKILKTRADLCVFYPFQHFTSQTYQVRQTNDATGIIPYNPNVSYQPSQLTAFASTAMGGSGYGGLNELYSKTFGAAPSSYQNPLFVAISIPNNPLTCLYIMVMREKDRRSLGYSTPNQYSPVLYWNCLELAAFNLTYSTQTLLKYRGYDEYLLSQLHERVEPIVIPWRGGPVCRRQIIGNHEGGQVGAANNIQSNCGFPGAWYQSYIYELCLVDQLPLKNEAFFQQTPSFRSELLNFNFWIKPSLLPWAANDFDFRSVTGLPTNWAGDATFGNDWYTYVERLAAWCPGIPQVAVGENPGTVWNLNNDNLSVVCVFAQNGLWQLNPLHCKVVFARGA